MNIADIPSIPDRDKRFEEITVDCYDEYEVLSSFEVYLTDALRTPFAAIWGAPGTKQAEPVAVLGVADTDEQEGVRLRVRAGDGDEYDVLADELWAEDAGSAARPDPPERIDTAQPFRASTANNHDNVRRGLACCAGSVVARVRVIADPRMELPDPGEILVARATDPGWIAAFVNAAGIIAERGSLLSHSAIVARELGVPCVVGLKGATEWLRSGDLVRLDGAAGTVELIEP